MGGTIYFEGIREGRRELDRQVGTERLAARLRSARQGLRPLNAIAGRLAARMTNRPQAAR